MFGLDAFALLKYNHFNVVANTITTAKVARHLPLTGCLASMG
jgi:hypothetical protein